MQLRFSSASAAPPPLSSAAVQPLDVDALYQREWQSTAMGGPGGVSQGGAAPAKGSVEAVSAAAFSLLSALRSQSAASASASDLHSASQALSKAWHRYWRKNEVGEAAQRAYDKSIDAVKKCLSGGLSSPEERTEAEAKLEALISVLGVKNVGGDAGANAAQFRAVVESGKHRLAKALFDFQAQQAGQLALRAGEVLAVRNLAKFAGWYEVESASGVGDVPANYVSLFPADLVVDSSMRASQAMGRQKLRATGLTAESESGGARLVMGEDLMRVASELVTVTGSGEQLEAALGELDNQYALYVNSMMGRRGISKEDLGEVIGAYEGIERAAEERRQQPKRGFLGEVAQLISCVGRVSKNEEAAARWKALAEERNFAVGVPADPLTQVHQQVEGAVWRIIGVFEEPDTPERTAKLQHEEAEYKRAFGQLCAELRLSNHDQVQMESYSARFLRDIAGGMASQAMGSGGLVVAKLLHYVQAVIAARSGKQGSVRRPRTVTAGGVSTSQGYIEMVKKSEQEQELQQQQQQQKQAFQQPPPQPFQPPPQLQSGGYVEPTPAYTATPQPYGAPPVFDKAPPQPYNAPPSYDAYTAPPSYNSNPGAPQPSAGGYQKLQEDSSAYLSTPPQRQPLSPPPPMPPAGNSNQQSDSISDFSVYHETNKMKPVDFDIFQRIATPAPGIEQAYWRPTPDAPGGLLYIQVFDARGLPLPKRGAFNAVVQAFVVGKKYPKKPQFATKALKCETGSIGVHQELVVYIPDANQNFVELALCSKSGLRAKSLGNLLRVTPNEWAFATQPVRDFEVAPNVHMRVVLRFQPCPVRLPSVGPSLVTSCNVRVLLERNCYFPGETVRGVVSLCVRGTPKTCLYFRISAGGYSWTHSYHIEGYGSNRHRVEDYETRKLYEHSVYLVGSKKKDKHEITPGNYIIPFELILPADAQPSMNYNMGDAGARIYHEVKAKMKTPFGKANRVITEGFLVTARFTPHPTQEDERQGEISFVFDRKNPLPFSSKVLTTNPVTRGMQLPFRFQIRNTSKKKLKRAGVELVMRIRATARGHTKWDMRKFASVDLKQWMPVKPGETKEADITFNIPALPVSYTYSYHGQVQSSCEYILRLVVRYGVKRSQTEHMLMVAPAMPNWLENSPPPVNQNRSNSKFIVMASDVGELPYYFFMASGPTDGTVTFK